MKKGRVIWTNGKGAKERTIPFNTPLLYSVLTTLEKEKPEVYFSIEFIN